MAWEDLVKGYEFEKGRFVVLTKDDFKTAALEKTKTIDILDFVDPEEIDDRFFETSYYLTPGKGSERAYALLREAIKWWTPATSVSPKQDEVRGKELEMAMALIDSLSAPWKPEQYTDEYRENLMRMIHAKVKGRKPRLKEEQRPQEAEVIDLMERLQRSLAASRGSAKKTPVRKTRVRKSRAA